VGIASNERKKIKTKAEEENRKKLVTVIVSTGRGLHRQNEANKPKMWSCW
jgi:hypothetical protein